MRHTLKRTAGASFPERQSAVRCDLPPAPRAHSARGSTGYAEFPSPVVLGRSQPHHLRTLALGFAIAVLFLFAFARPAAAATDGYAYSYSFSVPGGPTIGFGYGVAIDQSNGDVYVLERGNFQETFRLLKFDSAGNFLEAWGYGVVDGQPHSEVCVAPTPCLGGIKGTAPGQFTDPTGIAVDNSNGPNQGDVYVGNGPDPYQPESGTHGVVLKFDSSGNYLSKIDGAESDSGVFQAIGAPGPVSVDDNGFVWVVGGVPVSKYSNDAENEYVLGSEWKFDGYGPALSITANGPGTRLLVYGVSEPESPRIFSAGGVVVVDHLPCGGYWSGGTGYHRGTENFLVGAGGEVCEFTQKGVLLSRFGSGHLSGVGGIDANATTGNVYVGDVGQGKVSVFVPRVVPDVTTGAVADLGRTTATLTGQVAPDPDGGGNVTDCHFEVGTDTSYGTNVPCEQATPYSGSTAVTADLTGLTMETTYHYRLVAANSIDANRGEDMTFTPHAVLGLKTDAPTEVTPITATLNGSFDPDNDGTHYYFEWGTDTSYGNTTAAPPGVDAGSAPGMKSVSAEIGGLSSYTAYHYRIVAVNSLGTSRGEDETFRTAPPAAPTVSGTTATGIARDQATIQTVLNPDFGMTFYTLELGTNGTFSTDIPGSEPLDPDDADHSISIPLSGLEPGTTYQVRLVAQNFGGTTQGPTVYFTTLDAPSIASDEATGVTQTGATLTALINPKFSATTFHVEYGPTSAYGSATRESAPIGADASSHRIDVPLSGLTPGTAYHFRVVATNEIGTTKGVDRVFSTVPSQPTTLTTPAGTKCKPRFVRRKGRCVKRHGHKRGKRNKSRSTRSRGGHQ